MIKLECQDIKKDHKAVSRKASPLNNEGHDGKEGHMHRSIKKKER